MKSPSTPPGDASRAPDSRSPEARLRRALPLPLAFILPLFLAALVVPSGREFRDLYWTLLAAGAALLVWNAALYLAAQRSGERLTFEVAIRRPHWVQACAQLTVLLYWGWHVRLVYAFLPLIVVQLIFAYAVDSLLSLSRRGRYALGFGPFPVVLSINLFMWFRPEWFHWQFVMIVGAYLAKEFLQWNRGGRSAHIFNPSAFPLAVAALALLATGSWDITFGSVIANTQGNPPHMYLVIFLASLPGQILFGVAKMTMAAVLTLCALGLVYFGVTDTYLFFNAFIPVPVFLGMHLLITDPASSPRTESGRFIFGGLYGVGVFALDLFLGLGGLPTFYDKLLPVPILNLMARHIDRLAGSSVLSRLDPTQLGRGWTPGRRNLVYTSIWAGVFVVLTGVGGIGDEHPGQTLPFWQQACRAGSTRACNYLAVRQRLYCINGSGWACNELGIQLVQRDRPAREAFRRGCALGFSPACENGSRAAADGGALARARPPLHELPLLLRRKEPVRERDPARLYALACEQGWPGSCQGPPR